MDLAPAWMRGRATGNVDATVFRRTGEHLADVFAGVIEEYAAPPASVVGSGTVRVLDWGCGPGRVAGPLLEHRPEWDLRGCDVDGEAVAWCDANLQSGAFTVSALVPPVPYPGGEFDAIIACSVFTHLDWADQVTWLAELRRVLRPGGMLIASVHGEVARRVYLPYHPSVLRMGIFDDMVSTDMDGIIPNGRYRISFQAPWWTRTEWGKHLAVVDYRVSGLTTEHDLVICRREN